MSSLASAQSASDVLVTECLTVRISQTNSRERAGSLVASLACRLCSPALPSSFCLQASGAPLRAAASTRPSAACTPRATTKMHVYVNAIYMCMGTPTEPVAHTHGIFPPDVRIGQKKNLKKSTKKNHGKI